MVLLFALKKRKGRVLQCLDGLTNGVWGAAYVVAMVNICRIPKLVFAALYICPLSTTTCSWLWSHRTNDIHFL